MSDDSDAIRLTKIMTDNNQDSDRRAPSLTEVRDDILNEMYAEAEPPLDFDRVLDNPDSMNDDWYSQHFLSEDEQQRILDKHVERHNLTDTEHTALVMECILNLGPRGVDIDES